jgi:hypothetical protein
LPPGGVNLGLVELKSPFEGTNGFLAESIIGILGIFLQM